MTVAAALRDAEVLVTECPAHIKSDFAVPLGMALVAGSPEQRFHDASVLLSATGG